VIDCSTSSRRARPSPSTCSVDRSAAASSSTPFGCASSRSARPSRTSHPSCSPRSPRSPGGRMPPCGPAGAPVLRHLARHRRATGGPDLAELLTATGSLLAGLDAAPIPSRRRSSWADSHWPRPLSGCRGSAEQGIRRVTVRAAARPERRPFVEGDRGSLGLVLARARARSRVGAPSSGARAASDASAAEPCLAGGEVGPSVPSQGESPDEAQRRPGPSSGGGRDSWRGGASLAVQRAAVRRRTAPCPVPDPGHASPLQRGGERRTRDRSRHQ
jgi:hypothetical protein